MVDNTDISNEDTPTTEDGIFGDAVRTKRTGLKMTQRALAIVVGCDPSYISLIEVGTRNTTGERPHISARLRTKFDRWLNDRDPNPWVEIPAEELTEVDKPWPKPEPKSEPTNAPHRHKHFATLRYYVEKRQHTYLWGPPGSGKSTGAEHVAEALGLDYGYVSLNPQTSEFRLIGYKDAMGAYQETAFRQCYEHGGVFCVDELDNANPALLTTLNGMLESQLGAFPDRIVSRHKDFVFVATGNTNGRGATKAFPDRRKMDAAMMDRLVFVDWGYDSTLENKIATKIIGARKGVQIARWVQSIRRWAETHAPLLSVTPRATFRLCASLDSPQSTDELLNSALFHSIDADTKRNALTSHPFMIDRK